ncbi:uncharacterized protein MAM_01996 [Metarhizium album ARSEF 1941]|uniref:Uncharacterized protein n=1 Tax=Metarhizium album (strain ARSEF 1941) TaxID=1081103 RepID=A0A0B2X2U3_METAS|nr:uncharacterized protein MAM_01996 [Metarhizium album ARSEF 1941]KHO00073.1 hypothetical protein MAM_01996 [Metarhizium album ARSEF 1941]
MADSNMSYMYTATAYAALLGLGFAIYHVSTKKANGRTAANPPRIARTRQNEPRREDRKKKQRLETFTSEAQEASKAKARTNAAAGPPPAQSSVDDTPDDGVDNREFAKLLAKAKEGKKFSHNTEGGKHKEKSVKQSRANQLYSNVVQEKPTDTGAEADDDRSSVESPVESPQESPEARPVDASGISDMLEPAAAGPSVLRITDADKQKEKLKTTKAPQKTESKKQRQNRKKAEAAKQAREEAEKERRVLEEKQRRTARIAEGRPAKDGSQFKPTNGDSSWAKGGPNGTGAKPVENGEKSLHQPLDTVDKAAGEVKSQQAQARSENSWITSLPSEEEQLEMLKNDADEWSTVPAKSSRKSKKSSGGSGDEAPKQPAAQTDKPTPTPAPAPKPTSKSGAPQSFGAFSALDDGAAEEVEEEWDV